MRKKPYIEVSGRKGQGVKAHDLIDRLIAGARKEVDERHADSPESERAAIASAIAVGALRYFLLRFTRSTVIAFDFKDALSFEGETGPYVQYAVVRVNGIVRKGTEADPNFGAANAGNLKRIESGEIDVAKFLAAGLGDDLWDLALLAGSLTRTCSRRRAGTGVPHALCLRTGAGIQRLLSQAPHSLGRRSRKARVLAAPHITRPRAAHHHARSARNHRAGEDVGGAMPFDTAGLQTLVAELRSKNVLFEPVSATQRFCASKTRMTSIFRRSEGVASVWGADFREFPELENRLDFYAKLGMARPEAHNFRPSPDFNCRTTRSARPWDLFHIEHGDFWMDSWGARPEKLEAAFAIARKQIARAPNLIPIYAHRFLPRTVRIRQPDILRAPVRHHLLRIQFSFVLHQ